jgi:hypothetical protein
VSASQVGFFSHHRRQRDALARANAPTFVATPMPDDVLHISPVDDEELEAATRPDPAPKPATTKPKAR